MGRPVVLSNGQLFVGLDENGLVHDFYYPYVGLDNLTNARSSQHKVGIWVNGPGESSGGPRFSWTNDGSWQIDVTYHENSPVSAVRMHSNELGITLQFHDFIDNDFNAFIRSVHITNERDTERDIRLFMHQVFQISRAGRADTALYVPDEHYILDYKGRCCLAISGKMSTGQDFDQYAVGNYAIEGKAGTFKDAEDGELSDNNVEHGGVDSVLRFRTMAAAHSSFSVDYWIIAADSQTDAGVVHAQLKRHSIAQRRVNAQQQWKQWSLPSKARLETVANEYRDLATQSILVIKAHCDARGSILASGDSSIFNYGRDYYCYCWPRDAAYAIWPLIRLGQFDEAKRFFAFARDTMHPDGYLMHKYQPDRAIGSTWHPLLHDRTKELAIQEDETAIVLYMIGEYYRYSKDKVLVADYYDTFITKAADFMVRFVDESTGLPHASYDLWEQKFLTSTYTVSTVIAGLETAAKLAEVVNHPDDAIRWLKVSASIRDGLTALYHPDGYFRKGFLLQENGDLAYDDALDISSLYGPFMFAGIDHTDERILGTLKQVEERLVNSSPIGGVIRFEHDGYFLAKQQYKGNPWIVCTLWLAQLYLTLGRLQEARQLIDWTRLRALPSGSFSEQFDPENGAPLSVTPLVWSHAEFINIALDASHSDLTHKSSSNDV